MEHKFYKNIYDDSVVYIKSEEENYYILSDNVKINKKIFSSYYKPCDMSGNNINMNIIDRSQSDEDKMEEIKNIKNMFEKSYIKFEDEKINMNENKLNSNNDKYIHENNENDYDDVTNLKQNKINVDNFFRSDAVLNIIDEIKKIDTSKMKDDDNDVEKDYKLLTDDNIAYDHIKNDIKDKIEYNTTFSTRHNNESYNIKNDNVNYEYYKKYEDYTYKKEEDKINENSKYYESEESMNKNTLKNNDEEMIKNYKNDMNENMNDILIGKFKRNYNINITLNIEDCIASPSFVNSVIEGLESDITIEDVIKYYSKMIYNNFINNDEFIKRTIYNKVLEIYSEFINKNNTETNEKEANDKKIATNSNIIQNDEYNKDVIENVDLESEYKNEEDDKKDVKNL